MQEVVTQDEGVGAWFHPKLKFLFEPKRYKVIYGGRGGLKSWSVARALLLLGATRRLRVLCAREFQKSIKESVHELLESQIGLLGLGDYYVVQRDTIKGREGTSAEGTEFFFIGLHLNTSNVKSYEDVDVCWVEEADNVSESSWRDLTPTIRKPTGGPFGLGSEIWITFNPKLERDATYQRFVLMPPSDAIVQKTTYEDNPFLGAGMQKEISDDKKRNYDMYLHVWEGFCKQTLEGAVYADELREATTQGRIRAVPYDRVAAVNTYWDLGYGNHTSIWFVQAVSFEFRVIDFYENRLKGIDHYLDVLMRRGYLYDTIWLPHDAKAHRLGSKTTIEEQIRAKFPNAVRIVPRVKIPDKIAAARTVFPTCYFDEVKCADGLQHLRHYTYDVRETNDPSIKTYSDKPLHDEHSDAASAFEYFGVASRMPSRRKEGIAQRIRESLGGPRPKAGDPDLTGIGWMRN